MTESRPLLSPRRHDVIEHRRGEPLLMLARGFPSGAATYVVMLFVLASWLAASPIVLGYAEHPQAWSEWASAAAIFILGVLSLATRHPWLSWIAGAIGMWVLLAPIALWSPSAAAYANATVVGTLIAVAGLVFPLCRTLPGPEIPEGWSYNPAGWGQRAPVIVLAALSFGAAAYMAAYQLGYLDRIWDPLFGDGTRRVLTSEVSRAFPVSDAGLGAATYLIDLVMACAGDRRRWRTMPWLVILFGVLIVPVGVVSIVLIILQPVAVGAWCGWCLFTAAATLVMIPLAVDEVAATLQLLRNVRRSGGSWWRTLWYGAEHGATDVFAAPRTANAHVPWTLGLVTAAGVWIMLEPTLFGIDGGLADAFYIAGALVIVVAVIAMSEVTRALRFLALPLAGFVAVAPWWLGDGGAIVGIANLVVAAVIVIASLPRGVIGERRAGGDRMTLWPIAR